MYVDVFYGVIMEELGVFKMVLVFLVDLKDE